MNLLLHFVNCQSVSVMTKFIIFYKVNVVRGLFYNYWCYDFGARVFIILDYFGFVSYFCRFLESEQILLILVVELARRWPSIDHT